MFSADELTQNVLYPGQIEGQQQMKWKWGEFLIYMSFIVCVKCNVSLDDLIPLHIMNFRQTSNTYIGQ